MRSIGHTMIVVIGISLLLLFSTVKTDATPPDVSDPAIVNFLQRSFQYDYTTVTDDASLRRLVDSLDYQIMMINYRTILEKTAPNDISPSGQRFKQKLERRYQEIIHDGYLYHVFSDWQNKTEDKVAQAFIDLFLFDREQLISYPQGMGPVRSLAERLSGRLQNFNFMLDGKYYTVNDIRQLIAIDNDSTRQLARRLVDLRRDSSAVLASDAQVLYNMYNGMGLEKGGRTWQEYLFLPYSFDYPEWITIAQKINDATDEIYFTALNALKGKHHLENSASFEIDMISNRQAVLPDSFFTQDKINKGVVQLLKNIGLTDLTERLTSLDINDAAMFPATLFRYPPDDILFVNPNRPGFAGYYRLLSELGKALPWVYADSTLPYLLRTYAPGTAIMTSELFITLGTDPQFLASNFDIPEHDILTYTEGAKFLTLYQIRKVTQHILFDNKLSSNKRDDAVELYWSLENSVIGAPDSSYFWIDALISGRIEKYPNLLAQAFGRFKMREILYNRIGPDYAQSPETGRFLIDNFCRPGRAQSLEDFIGSYSSEPLSASDLKRQME